MIRVQVNPGVVKQYPSLTIRYLQHVADGGSAAASIEAARIDVAELRKSEDGPFDVWTYIDSSGLVYLLRFRSGAHYVIIGAAIPDGAPVKDIYLANGESE